MFVLYVMILLDYTIKTTECVLYQKIQLIYAIAEKEESRREEEQRLMPHVAQCRAHCIAGPRDVLQLTKPCPNKSIPCWVRVPVRRWLLVPGGPCGVYMLWPCLVCIILLDLFSCNPWISSLECIKYEASLVVCSLI